MATCCTPPSVVAFFSFFSLCPALPSREPCSLLPILTLLLLWPLIYPYTYLLRYYLQLPSSLVLLLCFGYSTEWARRLPTIDTVDELDDKVSRSQCAYLPSRHRRDHRELNEPNYQIIPNEPKVCAYQAATAAIISKLNRGFILPNALLLFFWTADTFWVLVDYLHGENFDDQLSHTENIIGEGLLVAFVSNHGEEYINKSLDWGLWPAFI